MNHFEFCKRGLVISLIALVAGISPVALANTYIGPGGSSCSDYVKLKQRLPDAASYIELWVLGYISGLNFYLYANKNIDLLARQTSADIVGFLQGYCSANGDSTINNAANEYWIQLSKRHRR